MKWFLESFVRAPMMRWIFAGATTATLAISFNISLAALIFKGDLSERLPLGIGLFLIGSAIVGAFVALGSSFQGGIAAPHEDAAIIISLMAVAIAKQLKEVDPSADPFPTILAAIAVTSLSTGAFFLLLGVLRVGILVRFIPYPVVGGFLAGAGWLLVRESISVMMGPSMTWDGYLPPLNDLNVIVRCVPATLLGLIIAMLLRRYGNVLLLPTLLVGSVGLFYAIVLLAGESLARVSEAGWLLGPFPAGKIWPPLSSVSQVGEVNWSVLIDNGGSILVVCILGAITVLLSASGVELATEEELDLDRELRVTGIGNLLAGLLGGMPSYLSPPESVLNFKAGAPTRLAGMVPVLLSVVVLVFGAEAMGYFPRPVLGGLIAFLGFAFLFDTVWEGWFRLRRMEYAVILVILLAIAVIGFLPGVGVGLVISFALFAASYSRIEVVRNAITGADLRSNVGRSAGEEKTLDEFGHQIHILQLQGYIFFGTAYRLLQRAQQRIEKSLFLVLDFRHVNGIDSSAVVSFHRLRRLAVRHGVKLILTELPNNVRTHLLRAGVVDEGDVCRILPDLDHGLEICEDGILKNAKPSTLSPRVLSRELEDVFDGPRKVVRFLSYLERVEAPASYVLFRQGDASKDLYLVESGDVTAWLEIDGKQTKRLRTMGPGTVVGESGLYLDATRSATVTTNGPATLYRLSLDALTRLTSEDPALAAAFHKFVARLLAQRIISATGAVKSLFN